MKSAKLLRKPMVYVPIGKYIFIGGERFKCVLRPNVVPIDACLGCAFRGRSCPPRLQCSKFDRRDGKFVWFVKG